MREAAYQKQDRLCNVEKAALGYTHIPTVRHRWRHAIFFCTKLVGVL
jgi:hypothetical protein